MRIIDINTLRNMFLELLDESKYQLENEGFSALSEIRFGTDKDDNFHEKIFTEYGIYNEEIAQVPNTQETLITPGIFAYDGAEIINNPSYDAYNVLVAFEFLAFEKQREEFRKLLERFASDVRGKSFTIYELGPDNYQYDFSNEEVPSSYIAAYTAVISTEMPILGETTTQSGYDRFPAYINMNLTVITSDIEIAVDTDVKIDGESIALNSAIFQRDKVSKVFNVRTLETESYAENQTFTISINGLLRNNEIGRKIKRNILGKESLNEEFRISFQGYEYSMFLKTGNIELTPNAPLNFTAAFSTRKEV